MNGRVLLCILLFALRTVAPISAEERVSPLAPVIDAQSLRGKVLCGYQGWFRCPGDASDLGWIHWSRDRKKIVPASLTFELWPDMTEYPAGERYPAPGFTDAAGRQAYLYSAENAGTVRRHFEWMRTYGIDGVWLQHFLVDLPGAQGAERYASRRRVLAHVRESAGQTGRIWALAFDIAGLPTDQIFSVLTDEWRRLVDEGVTGDARYMHEGGRPVVQIWGFYYQNKGNAMTAELANRLIDFFQAAGPYSAFLVGGGSWDWRRNPDQEWQAFYRRFDAYAPWNVGNTSRTREGVVRATTNYWAEDQRDCQARGKLWIPVIWPGFGWDNMKQLAPGTSAVSRRGGDFFWEQFQAAAALGVDSVCIAMFDEMDEGTAILKITDHPPVQAHFQTFEGKPSDWYLRLLGEATRLLREKRPFPAALGLEP